MNYKKYSDYMHCIDQTIVNKAKNIKLLILDVDVDEDVDIDKTN